MPGDSRARSRGVPRRVAYLRLRPALVVGRRALTARERHEISTQHDPAARHGLFAGWVGALYTATWGPVGRAPAAARALASHGAAEVRGMAKRILVIDVGGTHVKLLVTGEKIHREFRSGPTLTARQMVSGVKKAARGWTDGLR